MAEMYKSRPNSWRTVIGEQRKPGTRKIRGGIEVVMSTIKRKMELEEITAAQVEAVVGCSKQRAVRKGASLT